MTTTEPTHAIAATLGNREWLQKNEQKVKNLLPDVWTHMENMSVLKVGFGLKVLGVDWRSEDQLTKIMVLLEKLGLLVRQNGYQVRANPSTVYP